MKIDVDFEIFGVLAFYSSILLAKMIIMPVFISRQRFIKKVSSEDINADPTAPNAEVFSNPEDKAFARGGEVSIKHTDQDVERFRRAHLNDMENILPFFPLALMFCFTNPGLDCARFLFQIFTLSRIGHSVFYLVPVARKPWLRFGTCFVAWLINLYMAYAVFWHNL